VTGQQINSKLSRGLLGKYAIKKLGFSVYQLQVPSDTAFLRGAADSVTEQYHVIDAVWNDTEKKLTLSPSVTGEGYWIPYIGNGASESALTGMAQTKGRGLGTYTRATAAGISWVVTGPFTGCYTASFSTPNGKSFAHVVTPDPPYTADGVPNQVANIATQLGITAADAGSLKQVLNPAGEGFVFWTRIGAAWYRRVIYAVNGVVTAVESNAQI
jgi:hypothetical protein